MQKYLSVAYNQAKQVSIGPDAIIGNDESRRLSRMLWHLFKYNYDGYE